MSRIKIKPLPYLSFNDFPIIFSVAMANTKNAEYKTGGEFHLELYSLSDLFQCCKLINYLFEEAIYYEKFAFYLIIRSKFLFKSKDYLLHNSFE